MNFSKPFSNICVTKYKPHFLNYFEITYCCYCQVASVVSDSARPHGWQPTRLPRPWDSPGKNTGVGCHFLLQSMKVKSESEVAQSCPTLSDPMDCRPPGSSIHGIFAFSVKLHKLLFKILMILLIYQITIINIKNMKN